MHFQVLNGWIFQLGNGIEVLWNPGWFQLRATTWIDKSNQLRFVESLRERYDIQRLTDWRRVTASLIRRNGGEVVSG